MIWVLGTPTLEHLRYVIHHIINGHVRMGRVGVAKKGGHLSGGQVII